MEELDFKPRTSVPVGPHITIRLQISSVGLRIRDNKRLIKMLF